MNFRDPKSIKMLWRGFYVLLAVLILLDPKLLELVHVLDHDPAHEARFVVDGLPEFYALYGFLACVAMVLVSKLVLGKILMRADTYYDTSPLDPTRDSKRRPIGSVAASTEGKAH
jgi:hypothetical protein